MKTTKGVNLSILVATCNRSEMLDACVRSLLIQKPKNSYEIIVLDQSDIIQKETTLFSSEPTIKIVRCSFRNKSRALNQGVKLASANYIAVIDDDCIADKQWIDSMYRALKREPTTIITGRVIAGDKEKNATRSRLHDNLTERVVYQKHKITPIFKLSGCNFGFNRTIYKIIGQFNESFGPGSIFKSADDNEWSYRALRLGLRIIYTPEVIVIHRSWRGSQNDVQLMENYGYATGAFFGSILKSSKFDFLYHSAQLWRWLLKTIFLSFNFHEIRSHINYGVSFFWGFFAYYHQIEDKNVFDCIFVLSPGKYIGGAEHYVRNLACELYKQHRLNILIAISHNQNFYSECKTDNISSVYLGDTLKEASLGLSRLLTNVKIKTVISNGYHSSYVVFLARYRNLFRNGDCKFIDIKHGWIKTNLSERLKTFFDKLITISYDYAVIVNPLMENELRYVSKKKLLFVPSGISMKKIIAHKRQISNPLKILLIGRIAEEKRFGLVLEALSCIPKNLWQLTIVGDGPKTDELQWIAFQNGIGDRVRFTGYQPDVKQFYQTADLLIISSVSEGCPLVAIEAMAYRVLVLSTSVGYMPTLLNEQRGFLVGANITSGEMSEKIKEIIKLDSVIINQIVSNAWNYVYEHHNLCKNAEIFKSLIFKPTIV